MFQKYAGKFIECLLLQLGKSDDDKNAKEERVGESRDSESNLFQDHSSSSEFDKELDITPS